MRLLHIEQRRAGSGKHELGRQELERAAVAMSETVGQPTRAA
jgi:hypothetical protein